MRDLRLLVWLTQLGLSVALPLAGFVFLGLFLRSRLHWGDWVVVVGCVLGFLAAADGLRTSLQAMNRMEKKAEKEDSSVNFNQHE